jgi:hypothetical protein
MDLYFNNIPPNFLRLTGVKNTALTSLELDILTGCAVCGRRLIDNGKPNGTLVAPSGEFIRQRAVCWRCGNNPEAMGKLFNL